MGLNSPVSVTDESGLRLMALPEGGALMSGGGVTREVVKLLGSEIRALNDGSTNSQRVYIVLMRETREHS